jgi:hypothetical protein
MRGLLGLILHAKWLRLRQGREGGQGHKPKGKKQRVHQGSLSRYP